jgi:ribosomal protein S18 acetylase RimI-like enzyme
VSLDSPAWSSLAGAHASIAEVHGDARRYPPAIAPFAAIVDDAWSDLAVLVGGGNVAALFQIDVAPPDDWELVSRSPVRQMVAERPLPSSDLALEDLGADDVGEMLALVADTAPGPFAARTVELGGYLGIRDQGLLVAMAGQRMRPTGHGEISAVCTAPDHRGRGLAAELVRGVAAGIQARGDLPMLHVRDDNHAAIGIYERLGFRTRIRFEVLRVRVPRRGN